MIILGKRDVANYGRRIHTPLVLPANVLSPVDLTETVPLFSTYLFIAGRTYRVELTLTMVAVDGQGALFWQELPVGILRGTKTVSSVASVIDDVGEVYGSSIGVASLAASFSYIYRPSVTGVGLLYIGTQTGNDTAQLNAGTTMVVTDIS